MPHLPFSRLILVLFPSRSNSIDEGLRETALWNSVMLQSNDMLLAMKHFTEKRKGTVQFPGLGGKLTKAKL